MKQSSFVQHSTLSPCDTAPVRERQLTDAPYGHLLTNTHCFTPDGRWIVYDVRSDAEGARFDGDRIEAVEVVTGEVRVLYRSPGVGRVGVVTCSPTDGRLLFIAGPEQPTVDWPYAAWNRRGVVLSPDGQAVTLDARNLAPPYTPGALRGGSHVHVFDPQGQWISFTYEDAVLARLGQQPDAPPHEKNQRNVGVSVPLGPVQVPPTHPQNHAGSHYSVVVTHTVDDPRPGSDEISRACEEGWIGHQGYLRPDGTRQRRALAFQGEVRARDGRCLTEAFLVDLPEDPAEMQQGGPEPLAGTPTTRPRPPAGVRQRRLTYTADRRFPGLQGPRHWLRSSPDGARIACLMRDEAGIVQLWTLNPNGGPPRQLTRLPFDVASAFTWHPDGRSLAFAADNSLLLANAQTGDVRRLTPPSDEATRPLPLAVVFSPDGRRIAFQRRLRHASGDWFNQVCVVERGG